MGILKTKISWQMAVVLIAGGAFFTAIMLFAPESSREWLFGANGLLWSLVGYRLRYAGAEK